MNKSNAEKEEILNAVNEAISEIRELMMKKEAEKSNSTANETNLKVRNDD
ncbi:hypothetical protein RG959_08315 [Domibacillus sp. 8LH]